MNVTGIPALEAAVCAAAVAGWLMVAAGLAKHQLVRRDPRDRRRMRPLRRPRRPR